MDWNIIKIQQKNLPWDKNLANRDNEITYSQKLSTGNDKKKQVNPKNQNWKKKHIRKQKQQKKVTQLNTEQDASVYLSEKKIKEALDYSLYNGEYPKNQPKSQQIKKVKIEEQLSKLSIIITKKVARKSSGEVFYHIQGYSYKQLSMTKQSITRDKLLFESAIKYYQKRLVELKNILL